MLFDLSDVESFEFFGCIGCQVVDFFVEMLQVVCQRFCGFEFECFVEKYELFVQWLYDVEGFELCCFYFGC